MAAECSPIVLSCGCRIVTEVHGDEMVLEVTTCDDGEDCTYVQYLLAEASLHAKPIVRPN